MVQQQQIPAPREAVNVKAVNKLQSNLIDEGEAQTIQAKEF